AAYGDRDFQGRVKVIRPAIDPTSRAMTVEADFANPDFTLRPGMFATARVAMPEGEQGLFVPPSAILTDANTGASQVFVIENNKARAKVVHAGEIADGMQRIAGIPPGSMVATTNLTDLYDGALILN